MGRCLSCHCHSCCECHGHRPCKSTASYYSPSRWHCCLPKLVTARVALPAKGSHECHAPFTFPTVPLAHAGPCPPPPPEFLLCWGRAVFDFCSALACLGPKVLLALMSHPSKRLCVKLVPEPVTCRQDSDLQPGFGLGEGGGRGHLHSEKHHVAQSAHPFDRVSLFLVGMTDLLSSRFLPSSFIQKHSQQTFPSSQPCPGVWKSLCGLRFNLRALPG